MHVAIIMDGNGRWATQRRLPRSAGHRAGAKTVNRIVEAAARAGIRTLTLYAFSSANWTRPPPEVGALFGLLRRYLLTRTRRCLEQSIRINVIGRRDRLATELLHSIERSEQLTSGCTGMQLRIAVDYSAQRSLIEAARRVSSDAVDQKSAFEEQMAAVDHCNMPITPVDLLIRTGGEKRLSDFLLWECAYAELYFEDRQWPDFDEYDFRKAIDSYEGRERRFGQISAPAVARIASG